MPTNLYVEADNVHLQNSHIIPRLVIKFPKAKLNGDQSVTVYGTGVHMREFLHVDDMALAWIHVMGFNSKFLQKITH